MEDAEAHPDTQPRPTRLLQSSAPQTPGPRNRSHSKKSWRAPRGAVYVDYVYQVTVLEIIRNFIIFINTPKVCITKHHTVTNKFYEKY